MKKKVSEIDVMRKLTEMPEKELKKRVHQEIATHFFALEHFDKATWKGVRNMFIGVVLSLLASALSMLGVLDVVVVIILSSMTMGYSIALLRFLDYSGGLLKSVRKLMDALYGPGWKK